MNWFKKRKEKDILDSRSSSQVIQSIPQGLLLPPQPGGGVLQLQQSLLLSRRPLESAAHEEGEGSGEQIPPQILRLLLRLPVHPIRQPNHVLHVPLHLAAKLSRSSSLLVVVGLGAEELGDAEAVLALADEEEAVVHEALVLHDLSDAAHVGGAGGGVGEDEAEAEVGVEEGVHHDAVTELEDLEGEDGAGEEDQREGEQRELARVVVGLGEVLGWWWWWCLSEEAEQRRRLGFRGTLVVVRFGKLGLLVERKVVGIWGRRAIFAILGGGGGGIWYCSLV
ncbi:hypothetical protein Syun_005162 [Stephania yunnanensis]|uniref:Uncharacterized protein n=1 Tax=Stephania yunnanensis TaxID=152371 RepID=A0AAP0Q220_9MAGN